MIDCRLLQNSSLIRIKTRGMGGNVRKIPVTRDAAEKLLNGQLDGLNAEEREARITEALVKLKASTTLITCAELQAITTAIVEFKNWALGNYCNASFIDDGLYTVGNAVVPDLRAAFVLFDARLADLVQAFVDVYPERVAQAIKVWGAKACSSLPLINSDRLSKSFAVSYKLVQLDVPEGLPPEIREEEEAKLRKSFADAEQAITSALWSEFKAYLEDVTGKLVVGADGKKKIFRDTLFEDVTQFVKAFSNRNVFGDARLGELVKQAEAIVAKVGGKDGGESAQRMRDFEGLREQTRRAFDTLRSETEKAIGEEPSRSFNFDEA